MATVVEDVKIKRKSVEEILCFPTLEKAEKYIEDQKTRRKMLIDLNFGFGLEHNAVCWSETYANTAIRQAKDGNNVLIHVCFPFSSINLTQNEIVLVE